MRGPTPMFGKKKITILADEGYQHNQAIACSIKDLLEASLTENMNQIAFADQCPHGEVPTNGC